MKKAHFNDTLNNTKNALKTQVTDRVDFRWTRKKGSKTLVDR